MSESSEFKFFGGLCVLIGIGFVLPAFLLRSSGTEFVLVSCLWSAVGLLAVKTGRFIERLQARIKVLEAKLPDTDTGEISIESLTEN